jgi:hypothetical protein
MLQFGQAEWRTCALPHESWRCTGRLVLWPLWKLGAAIEVAHCRLRCVVCLTAPAKRPASHLIHMMTPRLQGFSQHESGKLHKYRRHTPGGLRSQGLQVVSRRAMGPVRGSLGRKHAHLGQLWSRGRRYWHVC